MIYYDAAKQASNALIRNWILIPAAISGYLIYFLSALLFNQAGFFGGMIVGLVQIFLISVSYCWLRDSVGREKIKLEDLYKLDSAVFSSVINTGFILFVAKFGLLIVLQGIGAEHMMILVQFALVIGCNALPEVLYLQRYESIAAIQESFEFIKSNWIEWFLPFMFFLTPWIFILSSMDRILLFMSRMDEMLPASVVFFSTKSLAMQIFSDISIGSYISNILALIIFIWYMLFRGFLFLVLTNSSRRKREYQNRIR